MTRFQEPKPSRRKTTEDAETLANDAFARFSKTGHPDDLALVFDHAAPRLLLIAARLAPRHAEDLVQQVFLEAIAGASRFEPGRPVLPWLTTILSRRASNLRRRADPIGIVDEDEFASTCVDPGDAAAFADVTDQILSAVRDLPAPYREVLHLRIVHELRPVEIAAALDRKLSVVNSQLHRGLKRLRLRLPAHLGSACIAAYAPKGLERMAAEVHSAASAVAPATPAAVSLGAAAIGLLTMKKTLVAVVVAALSLPILWPYAFPSEPAAPPGARAEEVAVKQRSSTRDAGGDGSVGIRSEVLAEEPDVPTSPPSIAVPRVELRGSCIDPEGKPFAGAIIEARQITNMAASPARGFSDAEGRFVVDLGSQEGFPGSMLLQLTVRAEGSVTAMAAASIGDGQVPEYADIPVLPGTLLYGSVTGLVDAEADGEDRPSTVRPELRIRRVEPIGVEFPSGFSVQTLAATRIGPEGRFGTDVPLPYGKYAIEIEGYEVLEPELPVVVDAKTRPFQLRVRPMRNGVIEGAVVDGRGQPLPARVLRASDVLLTMMPQEVPGDPKGRFLIRRKTGDKAAEVELLAQLQGFKDVRRTVAWGDRDARIVLEPKPVTTITVVAQDTGEPVTRFGLRRTDGRGGSRGLLELASITDHPDGKLITTELPAGTIALQVEPDPESGYTVSRPRTVDLSATRDLVLEVPRVAECEVLVVDQAGEPLPGASVRLGELVGDGAMSGSTLFGAQNSVSKRSRALPRDLQTTSAAGVATVRGSPLAVHGLRVECEGYARAIVERLALDTTASITVELAEAAVLHGRVTMRGETPASGRVYLRSIVESGGSESFPSETVKRGNSPLLTTTRLGVPLRDGFYEIGQIPVGAWSVVLVQKRSESIFPVTTVLGIVDGLHPGERRRTDFTLGADVKVTGRVQVDGQAVTKGVLIFEDEDASRPSRVGQIGADGSYSAELTESRSYRVRLRQDDGSRLAVPQGFRAGAVEEQLFDVDLKTESVRLRFLDPSGEAVEGLTVYPAGVLGGKRTDADGRVVIRVSVGRLELRVRPRSLLNNNDWALHMARTVGQSDRYEKVLIRLPAFEVTPGSGSQERVIRLPARWATQ